MNEENRKYHPVANIFPLMDGDPYNDLKNDIAKNGQLEEIWIDSEGSVIDGRNRHRACLDLGVTPRFRIWDGQGSLVNFIVSINLHRRHLTSGQQACAATEALPFYEAEAKERQATSTGGTSPQLVEKVPQADNGKAREKVAKVFNTNSSYVSAAKKLKTEAPDLFDDVRSGKKNIKRAKQELKQRKKVAEVQAYSQKVMTLDALDKVYNVIYADPPWKYTTGGGSNTLPGVTDSHYATMEHDDICQYLESTEIKTANDAVLFLWVTNPFLEIALDVVKEWGFKYKTNIVWRKTELKRSGVGYYVRGQHELLYICTRGSFTPLDKNISPPISSVIEAPLGGHSAKPQEVYSIIETLYPDCTYIELFSRNGKRNGWEMLGNES